MRLGKFVAIVMALSLCLPALTWARGEPPQSQTGQAEVRQAQERLKELGYYEGPSTAFTALKPLRRSVNISKGRG
jgi:hypothetical protein